MPIDIVLDRIKKNQTKAKVITLSSPRDEDENSFENPQQFVPTTSYRDLDDVKFTQSFNPWSIMVIRIKR